MVRKSFRKNTNRRNVKLNKSRKRNKRKDKTKRTKISRKIRRTRRHLIKRTSMSKLIGGSGSKGSHSKGSSSKGSHSKGPRSKGSRRKLAKTPETAPEPAPAPEPALAQYHPRTSTRRSSSDEWGEAANAFKNVIGEIKIGIQGDYFDKKATIEFFPAGYIQISYKGGRWGNEDKTRILDLSNNKPIVKEGDHIMLHTVLENRDKPKTLKIKTTELSHEINKEFNSAIKSHDYRRETMETSNPMAKK